MQRSPGVIEISGVPGSGKTTFITLHFPGQFILRGAMPASYGEFKRVSYSVILPLYALATGSISFRQIHWLIRKAASYDETLFHRLNALRNSMSKFGYDFFFSFAKAALIIDEGISHIPFILGLEKSEIYGFVDLFHQHLIKKSIIFIEAPPKEILIKRLITRGHKRVRTAHDAEAFVDRNYRIATQYKKALLDAGLDVTFK